MYCRNEIDNSSLSGVGQREKIGNFGGMKV